ncbi:MAG: hypothetical protein NVS2B6_20720 [Thermoleophilaceae bacterium]
MSPRALIGAAFVVVGAFAAFAIAIRSFESHPGLPSHINVGSSASVIAPGETDHIRGAAFDADPRTPLILLVDSYPYRHRYRVGARTSRLGPGGAFDFPVRPRVRTHYKVMSAVDHGIFSREIGVVVAP